MFEDFNGDGHVDELERAVSTATKLSLLDEMENEDKKGFSKMKKPQRSNDGCGSLLIKILIFILIVIIIQSF